MVQSANINIKQIQDFKTMDWWKHMQIFKYQKSIDTKSLKVFPICPTKQFKNNLLNIPGCDEGHKTDTLWY